LDKNAKQIDLIVEASKKPHYFSPIVTEDTLVSALPSVSIPRTAAQALRCRAFNHFGEGRYDQGLSDFAAGQRIARVASEAPFVVGLLIGTGIELAFLEATRSI